MESALEDAQSRRFSIAVSTVGTAVAGGAIGALFGPLWAVVGLTVGAILGDEYGRRSLPSRSAPDRASDGAEDASEDASDDTAEDDASDDESSSEDTATDEAPGTTGPARGYGKTRTLSKKFPDFAGGDSPAGGTPSLVLPLFQYDPDPDCSSFADCNFTYSYETPIRTKTQTHDTLASRLASNALRSNDRLTSHTLQSNDRLAPILDRLQRHVPDWTSSEDTRGPVTVAVDDDGTVIVVPTGLIDDSSITGAATDAHLEFDTDLDPEGFEIALENVDRWFDPLLEAQTTLDQFADEDRRRRDRSDSPGSSDA